MRFVAICFGAFFLGGCAVPVPVQVASWALDGLSYLMTEKSVTDHGISIVAEKDCALLRGIIDGEICRDWNQEGPLLASRKVESKRDSKQVRLPQSLSESIDANVVWFGSKKSDDNLAKVHEVIEVKLPNDEISAEPESIGMTLQLPVTANVGPPVLPSKVLPSPPLSISAGHKASAGIYYVIGSFRNFDKALEIVAQYEVLTPQILTVQLPESILYRVLSGPVSKGQEQDFFGRMENAGLRDSWAIWVKPGQWLSAGPVKIKRKPLKRGVMEELARVPE